MLESTNTNGGCVGAPVGRYVAVLNDKEGVVEAQLSLVGSFFLSIATEGALISFPFPSKKVAT